MKNKIDQSQEIYDEIIWESKNVISVALPTWPSSWQ